MPSTATENTRPYTAPHGSGGHRRAPSERVFEHVYLEAGRPDRDARDVEADAEPGGERAGLGRQERLREPAQPLLLAGRHRFPGAAARRPAAGLHLTDDDHRPT